MNYTKIYEDLITRGKNRELDGYKESHHIIPRCLGGTDDKENIVDLTAEEHYVAHQLLVKIHLDNHSLAMAAQMMIPNRKTNKMYGWLRKRFSVAQSSRMTGNTNHQFGTIWIYHADNDINKKIKKEEFSKYENQGWVTGRKVIISDETRAKMKATRDETPHKHKGSILVNNGVESKMIQGEIPEGWEQGAVGSKLNRQKKKEERKLANVEIKKQKLKEKVDELRPLYEIYKVEGFEGVQKNGYAFSTQNLINAFNKYLPEFVSHRGKPRKQK